MTMDKTGLLLLSSADKVTVGLLPWDGPGEGLRLLLRDTDRFSSHVNGTLGMLPGALGILRGHLCRRTGGALHLCLPGSLCLYSLLTSPCLSGQFYQDVLWGPPTEADDSKRTLRVQGRDYSATR